MKRLALTLLAALALPAAASAQEVEPPTPSSIVAAAQSDEWVAIAAEDLLVMQLASDAAGRPRQVVIQLIAPPFSQPWVQNIRTLARAGWWDGTSVYRVVDNWVAQWGDGEEEKADAKALPAGVMAPRAPYEVDEGVLSDILSAEEAAHWAESPQEATLGPEDAEMKALFAKIADPSKSEAEHDEAVLELIKLAGLAPGGELTSREEAALISIAATALPRAPKGWHERDSTAEWVEFWKGWPIANEQQAHWENDDGNIMTEGQAEALSEDERYRVIDSSVFWPIHCYATVGVARDLSPDTGTGAELYAVIGHAPRHLDRNIALVGRVIEGIEHLSSLPRGTGAAGVYESEAEHTPIVSVRLASELPPIERPRFEYLASDSESFHRYIAVRANRSDAFYRVPAGGVDVCNIQVPVRRVIE